MNQLGDSEVKNWFALNYISKAGQNNLRCQIDNFNHDEDRLDLFAPVFKLAERVNGKVVFKEKLLTISYVFVRGTLSDVKALCALPDNGFSFVLNRSSNSRYAIVSNSAMDSFMIFARAYTNPIPFFNIEDIELEEGDIVEVVSGEYAGLKGTFMPKSRSSKGNIVIAATAAMGAVLWNIDAKYVRILEFARNTRRQYDLLDSFIPKLFPILRKFHARENFTDKEKSLLTVFNQRMGVVVPQNHKLEAKLLATLMCVQTILGDLQGYNDSIKRFQRRNASVTNPWTSALINLMLCVSKGDIYGLSEAYNAICGLTDSNTSQRKQLLQEYQYYLHPAINRKAGK